MRRLNFKKLFILSAIFFGLALDSVGQTVPEEQVTVIAPYNPSISKAQKINSLPANETNANSKFRLDYSTNPKLISTTFNLKELKAAQYLSPKTPQSKQNVVRVGAGLYTTPLAELSLNGKLKKDFTLGLHLRHLSSKASVDDFAYSGFSNNNVDFSVKKTGINSLLAVSVFYQRDAFHYYGFRPGHFPVFVNLDSLTKQLFSDAGFRIKFQKAQNAKKELFEIDGAYRYFQDNFLNIENLINISVSYQRPFEFLGIKKQFVGLNSNTEIAITNWENYTQEQAVDVALANLSQQFFHGKTDLNLFYSLQYDRFNLKIGGGLSVGLDSSSTIKIYPNIELRANIIKNVLDTYILFDGGLISPSYYSLSRENPFVNAFLPLNYSSRDFRLKAGLKANILGQVDVHLWGSKENISDKLFFVSDTNGFFSNQFSLIYDDVELLQIGGNVAVNIGKASVGMELNYQKYTLAVQAQAWYQPQLKGQLSADYWLYDNVKLSMDIKGQSIVWAKVGENSYQIDPWVDLSLGGNYYFKKDLHAFVQINNVLSKKYEIWYNYPVKGFGAMLGISYAF
ncbi:MAG TPA: hypothetical protein DCG69_02175 [Bacteroidales bacterium]|nr:hypothetical protein [Bacteroidales bacterium]